MLLDHSNACIDSFPWRGKIRWLVFPQNFTAVCSVKTKYNINKCGLSGSVLTEESMDFTFFYRKTDIMYRYVSFEEETWFSPFSRIVKVF